MKKFIFINLLFVCNMLLAQMYQPTNGSFENLNGGQPHEAFTKQNLGNSWYAHKGNPDSKASGFNNIVAPNGNRFAHAWHRVENFGGSNWKRTGESFFMYYPMQAGSTYNLKFKLKSSGYFDHFYVIATNEATPNFSNDPATHNMNTNISNNINNVINTGDIVVNHTNSNGTWQQINIPNFSPTQNYTKLLFIPYLNINSSNLTTKQGHVYIDDVHFTGNIGPSNLSMVLNGANSNTNVGISICSGENVILDASKTVDTHESLAYFIQIHQKNSNGTTSKWFTQWYQGLPYSLINLSQLYPYGFTSPEGTTTEYNVKLAINSGPTNSWYEKQQKIIVNGGPSFNFGLNLINTPGYTATRKVHGLPSGNYSYKWYEGTNTNSSVISTSNQIYIYKNLAGNYPYTVTITDNTTGCSTTKTTYVLYIEKNTIDPYEELGPKRLSENAFKVYPNPVVSSLKIQSKVKFDTSKIFDINGVQIMDAQKKTIDVHSLKKGPYIIKIYNNKTLIATQKFIKN